MKVTASFKIPRINIEAYRKKLHDQMSAAISHAAFEWLGAVTAIIPVWSGASLATFLPLASQIQFGISVSPVPSAPNRFSLGLSHGEGSLNMDAATGRYTFRYETTLSHLVFNEFNNANAVSPKFHLINPGPYHFQQKGAAAFQQYVPHVRLPGLAGCIKTKTIVVR